MTDRIYDMRLSCNYTGDENDIKEQEVELLGDGMWQAFDLDMQSPGFLIFVYAVFHCQHRLFRVTAARQGLMLDTALGSIKVTTDTDWKIKTLRIEFEGKLLMGRASQESIDTITSAMKNCPVSVNLCEVEAGSSDVRFI